MVPIVHRPSFRKAVQEDQDREDDGFLALILSIAALVVATMRSRFQAYQSDSHSLRFSSRKEFIHFCYQKVMGLRTSSYFDELNFQKFAVPYLFFAAYLQLGDHNWAQDLMPLEVDDELIFEHEVLASVNNEPCLVSPQPSTAADDPCACMRAKDPRAQVLYFQERLDCLQNLLIDIPSFLQPWESSPESFDENVIGENTKAIQLQFSSLRANLHVTHLWLQSLVLDQLEAAQSHQQAHPSATNTEPTGLDQRSLWLEREKICRQLFFILFNFPRLSLEANGLHLANKVRDIMTSLLACPFHPDDPISKQAAEYVQLSTEILSRLDSSESMNTMHLQTWVDTDRIKR
ncbi:hypothetical protein PCG10_007810 [Penicillium crustosum]|uniref:Uncharacterized protein n=1 Tax=Penicillium crustosum TaxID=36656 RepID=A0A9P5GLZ7_PENCR|nr:hypothetical protein PCG10_007810 [Penicillium crustosum]